MEGYYLYIETSTGLVGNKAVLVSPQYQQTFTRVSPCQLSFWYHMYGSSIGTLSVYLNDATTRTRVWSLRGLYSVNCITCNRNNSKQFTKILNIFFWLSPKEQVVLCKSLVEACVEERLTPRTPDLDVRGSSLARRDVSLDKELCSTLSLST